MMLKLAISGSEIVKKDYQFDESYKLIDIGRDATVCQVVFPADETIVGRRHCALRLKLNCWELVLNEKNVVFVDGQPALDGDELAAESMLQLGPDGPILQVETEVTSRFPATVDHGDVTPKNVMVKRSDAISRRAAWIAVAGIILLLGAAGLGLKYWHDQQATIHEFIYRFDELSEKDRLQLAEIVVIKESQENLEGEIARKTADFEVVLSEVQKSVYLVLVRDADGYEEPMATAWVLEDREGVFATNAHVAEDFEALRNENKELVLRSSVEPRHDLVVSSVLIHPGYEDFNTLWSDYRPVARPSALGSYNVEAAGPACDVALMTVTNPQGIGPPLRLAKPEEIATLRAGTPVAFVGYPMEGLVLAGVNPQSPTPTSQIGYITAVTNYLGSRSGPFSERLLVHHALPSVGGASGSPIVNEFGRVVGVLNAGNDIMVTDDNVRVGSSAQVNYAQRADLLIELQKGTAEKSQAERMSAWKRALSESFQHGEVAGQDISSRNKCALYGDYSVTENNISPDSTETNGERLFQFSVADIYSLRIEVSGPEESTVPPLVSCSHEGKIISGTDFTSESLPGYYLFRTTLDSTPVDVQVILKDEAQSLEVTSLTRGELRTWDERLERARQEARVLIGSDDLREPLVDDHVILEPLEGKGIFAAIKKLTLESAGRYAVIMAPEEGVDVDLTAVVYDTAGEAVQNRSVSDDTLTTWGTVVLQVNESDTKSIGAVVHASASPANVKIEVYRAQ